MAAYPVYMGCTIYPDRLAGIRVETVLGGRLRRVGWLVRRLAVGMEQNIETVSDIEDVRQSREGDSDAYRRLVERHQGHVSKIMWRFSRDFRVHEDLVQDVFVEAYMSLAGYRRKAPFAHWLARIATRVGYGYWKKKARRREAEFFTLEQWDRLPDEPAEKMDPSEAAALVHRLLARLRPRDRLVLTLRYLEGCDVAETAHRTGWTKSMVKVQTLRARKKLENLLARACEEVEE
jgi:RNA polymerase sigma factor (sigma-70 family)